MDPIVQAALISSLGLVIATIVTAAASVFDRRRETANDDALREEIRRHHDRDKERGQREAD